MTKYTLIENVAEGNYLLNNVEQSGRVSIIKLIVLI